MDKQGKKIKEFFASSRRKKFWITAASLLAFAAVFTTVHFLILPAATMEKQPVCGLEEHQHTDSCYKDERVLVCTLPEDENHKHTDECYKIERTLICTKKEHVHTAECFKQSDLKADKESEEDWKRSVAPAKLNGKWAHDILEIAKTQMDYSESEDNFVYSTDGEKKGYTRYGDWFGNKYADWNSMFVSFCLNYADVPNDVLPYKTSADIKEWVTALKKRGLYKTADKNVPEAGDLLFLDNNKDGKADDVAIIDEVKSDEAGKGKVTAIKGNSKDKVEAKSYSLKDKVVMGFGALNKAQSRNNAAMLAASHTQKGKYWKINKSLFDLHNGGTYVIVSAEGNYALTNNQKADHSTQLELEPVKGNPDYYTINNVPENAKWTYTYTGSRSFSQLKFVNLNLKHYYVNPYYSGYDYNVIGTQNINLGVEVGSKSCFRLSYGGCYLNYDGVNKRFVGSTDTNVYYGDQKRNADTRDMLLLELVDKTLTIPDDVVADPNETAKPGTATKPNYPAYINPSDKKTGTYEDPQGTVHYYSDPSTSQLEKYFGNHPLNGKSDFDAQKVDDGKALMDKSVIYKHDDYGAIPSYEDGTFGVTLSALGQSFIVNQSQTKVPIDVLIVIDMSGSMNDKDAGQSKTRANILVESLNKTINNIMISHPQNRVCVAGFNSGSYQLLDLRHHSPINGKFFNYSTGTNGSYGTQGKISSVYAPGTGTFFEEGTYTQLGIAEGYALMTKTKDTTYTVTENGQTVTRKRKPVIVLVSDGEPTHCTNHYMDPLNKPYYGDGIGDIDRNSNEVENPKGIMGYYTLLTANYIKRMVGIHYDNPATMYTVAFGMKENDPSRIKGVGGYMSGATNHYRATIMNPTPTNIETLKTIDVNNHHTNHIEKMLYGMLKNTYNSGPVMSGAWHDLIPELGKTHCLVPYIKNNPYRNDINYVDKAYLNNTGNNGLDAAFEEIIQLNTVYDYSYETQANRPLTVSDPIGEGMEIKGDPVLRFAGKNYNHVSKNQQGDRTIYSYSGVVPMDSHNPTNTVDLSTIKIIVERDVQGNETVIMEVPPKSLPIYTADKTMSFYYEALPVRAIYKVGLSQQGQAKIDSLAPGQTATFYTNRYTGSAHANGRLDPSDKNKFYITQNWKLNNIKTDNTTATDNYSLNIGGTNANVLQSLGNNGKLVITKNNVVKKDLSVQKKWLDYSGKETTEKLPKSITATLYRTYEDENGKVVREDVLDFTLDAENGWKKTFTYSELKEVAGREYKYYVNEQSIEGYKVKYEFDGVSQNTPDTPIVITNRYKFGDMILPSTGGPGIIIISVIGLALMIGAGYGYVLMRRKNKGDCK